MYDDEPLSEEERVYCVECKWYFFNVEDNKLNQPLHQCIHPSAQKEIGFAGSPIQRPYKILSQNYADCMIKNQFNNCNDFEPKEGGKKSFCDFPL